MKATDEGETFVFHISVVLSFGRMLEFYVFKNKSKSTELEKMLIKRQW